MISKRHILLAAMAWMIMAATAFAQRKGFAVVIDPESRRQAATELSGYVQALEEVQGFRVYTVEDRWGVPDSIRAELQRLHGLRQEPIVGAVFIGDIPVPMIRDAQFLTSAFKMSQRMPWRDSSVPSDRFYDDFGLRFQFLKKDSLAPLFYYSLSYEGNQQLRPDLFTGRIRPTDAGGTSRYEKLRAYFRKATEAKRHPERVQAAFVYTGSGSLSESKVGHIDEMLSLREHFPSLAHRPGAFSYMDYSDERFVKRKLMNEMMRPDLSIGLMHHHGDFDTQYLTSYPKPSGTEQALEYLLYSYRYRLRRSARYGQDVDSVRRMLTERDHLPVEWLQGEPSAENEHRDSLMEDSLNLTLKDFATYGYRPNCRIAIYDACYNGAFQNDDCIANEYIFQPGKTIAGLGGTVNVLQDKWPDRYIGLLSKGLMVGRICQLCPELEMHVVGDPTFVFENEGDVDFNALLVKGNSKAWKRLLEQGDADSQCLAMKMMGAMLTDRQLLDKLKTSPYALVRLQAFMLLQERNHESLVDAILQASTDNFELLQRFAVNAMQKCGDPRLAPALARLLAGNNTSARVAFNAMQAVQFFPGETITQAVAHALDSIAPYVTWQEEYRQRRTEEVSHYAGRWADDIQKMVNGGMTEKRMLSQADRMKIYLPPYLAEDVARYTEQCDNPELQIQLLSSLGWHRQAYTHAAVTSIVERMSHNESLPAEVRHEAVKTWKRLQGASE